VALTTRAEHFSKTPGGAPAMLAVMSGMAPWPAVHRAALHLGAPKVIAAGYGNRGAPGRNIRPTPDAARRLARLPAWPARRPSGTGTTRSN